MITARASIAAAETALVRAMLVGDEPPPGVDRARLVALGETLVRKRARDAARAWPVLASALGSRFEPTFAEYARGSPGCPEGGGLADGRMFARFVKRTGPLPDRGRIQVLAFDLRYRVRAGGLVRRRWALRTTRLRRPPQLVVGVRLPWGSTRVVMLPLGRRARAAAG